MRLSVVVTIVDSGEALRRCLNSLEAQSEAGIEVIVPWDSSLSGMPELAGRFRNFRFLDLGPIEPAQPLHSPRGQHELFDRRRSAGLAAATGDVVAILEDRGVPRHDWAQRMLMAHQQLPHAVIGGAIDNGHDAWLAWAVFFCDFNRYQPPFEAGRRAYVSDVNVGYKRRALDATRHLWQDRYHETTVHWALERAGETLYLSPEFAVDQIRTAITVGGVLRERFAWGRLFAYTRAKGASPTKRWLWSFAAPCLPIVLMGRHALLQARKRRTFGKFLAASPAVLLLLIVWSAGELIGYVTGRP